MRYCIYILSNKVHGTLYVGITNNLVRRVYEHKHDLIEGFTRKHQLKVLVYYEGTDDVYSAIQREKNLKRWRRAWKIHLIETSNPNWRDLYPEII